MKTKTLKALLLLTLANVQVSALAGGISGIGGGNSVNHKLVERYALSFKPTPPKDVLAAPGRAELEEKLQMLERELPEFGREVRAHFSSLTFYAIPAKLRKLPVEQTGLDFKNEQTALQKENEVFVDSKMTRGWKPKDYAELYLHEAIMNMTESKRSPDVRKAVVKIFEPGATPDEIQQSLVQNHLGVSFTRKQQTQVLEFRRKLYVERLSKAVDNAEDSCENGETSLNVLGELAASDVYSGDKWCVSAPGKQCEGFQSPFKIQATALVYDVGLTNPWLGQEDRGDGFLANRLLNGADPRPSYEVLDELLSFRRKDPQVDTALREKFANAASNSIHGSSDAGLGTFHELYQLPVFTNILASYAVEHNNLFDMPTLKRDARNGFSSTSFPEVRKFHQAVLARTQDLNTYSPEKRRELLCNSVKVMKTELTRIHDKPAKPADETHADPTNDGANSATVR